MKIRYQLIIAILSVVFLGACTTEEAVVEVNPVFEVSYLRDGQINAYAGTPIYVYKKGSAEFVSVYSGAPGAVYGAPGSKGTDFVLNDSLPITYDRNGSYTITFVSSSAAKFGMDIARDVRTVNVNVIDVRNSFKTYSIGTLDPLAKSALGDYVNGKFTHDSILFTVPDVVKNVNFSTLFNLDSPDAIVTLNGALQTSITSKINFIGGVAGDVVGFPYVIKAHNGNEQSYKVAFKIVASAIDTVLYKFNIAYPGNNEIATINQEDNTINLLCNPNTDLSLKADGKGNKKYKFTIESSLYSSVWYALASKPTVFVKYQPSLAYYLSGSDRIMYIKVIAQDGVQQQIFSLNVSQ